MRAESLKLRLQIAHSGLGGSHGRVRQCKAALTQRERLKNSSRVINVQGNGWFEFNERK